MSGTTKTVVFSAILGIGGLLAWSVSIPTEVKADPSPRILVGGHLEHGGVMRDFVRHSLRGLLRQQKDLGLSEEQRTRIKSIATDYAKTRVRGEADVKLAEIEVRTLIRDEKAELSAIETAMKKAESAHTALRLEGVKALRAASAVLTPEQREKWRANMREGHRTGRHRAEHAAGPGAGEETNRQG